MKLSCQDIPDARSSPRLRCRRRHARRRQRSAYGSRTLKHGATGGTTSRRSSATCAAPATGSAPTVSFGPRTDRPLALVDRGGPRAARRRRRHPARAARDQAGRSATRHRRRHLRRAAAARQGRARREGPRRRPTASRSRPHRRRTAVKEVIAAGNKIAKHPVQVGRRPRQLERHRLRLLGLGVLRPARRRSARHPARLGRLRALGPCRASAAGSASTRNGGHVYMVVAGMRFDTSARKARARAGPWAAPVERLQHHAPQGSVAQ